MNELKTKINDANLELVEGLMDIIKEGKAKGGIDLTNFITSLAQHNNKINGFFVDFEERMKEKKKGRW